MNVTVKPGVVIKVINSQLCHVCYTVWFIWKEYGLDAVMTSANDGSHMAGSLHYKDLAWDFRIWGLDNPGEVCGKLRSLLNAKHHDYDVVLEPNHAHVEYDPKPTGDLNA
jgi:hypothetical protein